MAIFLKVLVIVLWLASQALGFAHSESFWSPDGNSTRHSLSDQNQHDACEYDERLSSVNYDLALLAITTKISEQQEDTRQTGWAYDLAQFSLFLVNESRQASQAGINEFIAAKTPAQMWEEAAAQAEARVSAASSEVGGLQYKAVNATFDTGQLQAKFKHAADFGISGNHNKVNGAAFQQALESHISDASSQLIQGTYRGNPVTHIVNPQTGLNVVLDPAGNFLSGWKLNSAQLQNVLSRGSL